LRTRRLVKIRHHVSPSQIRSWIDEYGR
jgi:uncharacterized protein YjcR